MNVENLDSNDNKKIAVGKMILTQEEKSNLVKFFSILIDIDQRNKRKSNETKTN